MVKVLPFKFQHIWARLPWCFSKDPLKRDFWDIDLTRFFWVCNFGNISGMRVIFFQKMFKIQTRFQKCIKNQENLFAFEIIASELVALNCLYQEQNTCHRHSVSCERVLRFCMSLTETFCKSIVFTVINKYGKGADMQISTMFWRVDHVAFRMIPWNGTF